jgi:hypothetical protein
MCGIPEPSAEFAWFTGEILRGFETSLSKSSAFSAVQLPEQLQTHQFRINVPARYLPRLE